MQISRVSAQWLVVAGILFCLLQVWLPACFITGDGPCHVYNAGILHEIWWGKDASFFGHFYEVVGRPNPNWLSHILLALMTGLVSGILAEKILLTCYIILLVTGCARIIRRLDPVPGFWQAAALVFVFHYVLAKGFYNFSISVGLMVWMIDTWLAVLDQRNFRNTIIFFTLVCLTFTAHPVAFVFGACTCFTLLGSAWLEKARLGSNRTMQIKNAVLLLVCLLPGLILLVLFAAGEVHDGGLSLHLARYKLLEFADFNCLVNLTGKEAITVKLIWLALIGLFVYAMVVRGRGGWRWHRHDGFLATMIFALFVYLYFPDKLFGGSLFVVRAQYLWGIFMFFCIGYLLPAGMLKQISGGVFLIGFVWLGIIRIGAMKTASDGVADILSAAPFIAPGSVILPLDFSPGGLDEHGNTITDRNWLFCHAWQYMGAGKKLIFLDNYEANTGYFPLVWKDAVNPYHHLCKNGEMENQPPHAGIATYELVTGVQVNYVLMWCYQDSWLADAGFSQLYREIEDRYRVIYRSPTGRTLLYQRR